MGGQSDWDDLGYGAGKESSRGGRGQTLVTDPFELSVLSYFFRASSLNLETGSKLRRDSH